MPLLAVKSLTEIPSGSVIEVEHGEATYAVGNADGRLFCMDGLCPHAGGPLGQGFLDGDNLICPWHAWQFNCGTGLNDSDEDSKVSIYPVIVRDGNVLIDIP